MEHAGNKVTASVARVSVVRVRVARAGIRVARVRVRVAWAKVRANFKPFPLPQPLTLTLGDGRDEADSGPQSPKLELLTQSPHRP